MKFKRLTGALGALVLGLGVAGAVALSASPAAATDDKTLTKPSGRCATFEVETPGFLSGNQVEVGGATVEQVGDWTQFKTPADDAATPENELEAYARWEVNPEDFKLKDLKNLTYTTLITEDGTRGSVAPAVRLVLADGTKLVYEPYWNGPVVNGAEDSWTVTTPGAKLWDNGAEPAADETWADWLVKKGDVKVTSINVGVGTYNEGANVSFKNLRFAYLLDCKPLDIVVTQPACDEKTMTVKFTNPNAKVNAWLWNSTDPSALRMLKPGESWTVTASADVKYAYLLQKSKFGGTFNAKNFKRQMTFQPGKWVADVIKFVASTACPTTPATTEPTTGTPTTPPATTAPATTPPATTEAPVPAGNVGDDDGGSLAKTGAPTLMIGGAGVLLFALGGLLLLFTRRRREEQNLDQTAQLPAVQ